MNISCVCFSQINGHTPGRRGGGQTTCTLCDLLLLHVLMLRHCDLGPKCWHMNQ